MSEPDRFRAGVSLDLDNTWSYLKIHGDSGWESYPSHFSFSIPFILKFLKEREMKITFFIVGKDASIAENLPWLKQIVAEGHEVGNHSYLHEPWIQDAPFEEVFDELKRAHEAILAATGLAPEGFRGPGFCHSESTLEAVKAMGYAYDASVFPTIIGPLARFYYFCKMSPMDDEEKKKRKSLFGTMSRVFFPNKPFVIPTKRGDLMEIPVTTIPVFRLPFHLSYVLWLSQFSEFIAINYFRFGLLMCKLFRVKPSILLHPLDFLGKDDIPELAFFPGMNLLGEKKRAVLGRSIDILRTLFNVGPIRIK